MCKNSVLFGKVVNGFGGKGKQRKNIGKEDMQKEKDERRKAWKRWKRKMERRGKKRKGVAKQVVQ